jgi:hypothetical protein
MIPMHSQSIYKIPQGKLLKIHLEYNVKDHTITSIKIMGDFFVYPEEAIELLEKKLKHTDLKKAQLIKTINAIVKDHNIQFIGLDAEGLTQGILMCVP